MTGDREMSLDARVAQQLPTFIVIGAMKAGTTSLYHYLRNHPQIFMPKVKELDFFAAESNWSRGLDWYRQQFSGAVDAPARGEASTLYTKYPQYDGVPERIAGVVPGVRLVYLVRDPIVRMRSHYQHRVALGAETAPPEVALLENPIYLAYSRYAMQLERYLEHFPREQLHVVTSEALRGDRTTAVQGVYEFLQVDPTLAPAALGTEFYRTAHRRSYPPAVYAARQFLKHHVPQAKRAKELVDSVVGRRAGSGPAGSAGGSSPAPSADLISARLHEQLADLLRDDVARLRPYMAPGFDGWGLA
jgi:hypothetical protein